jgi:hypothetical protein
MGRPTAGIFAIAIVAVAVRSPAWAGDSNHMNTGKGQSCQKNEVEIQVDHLHSQLPVYEQEKEITSQEV